MVFDGESVELQRKACEDQAKAVEQQVVSERAEELTQALDLTAYLRDPDVQGTISSLFSPQDNVDSLKQPEVIRLEDVDIAWGESAYIELDGKTVEIGLTGTGQVFLADNGRRHVVDTVKAGQVNGYFFKQLLSSDLRHLKKTGAVLNNIVRLRGTSEGVLLIDYLWLDTEDTHYPTFDKAGFGLPSALLGKRDERTPVGVLSSNRTNTLPEDKLIKNITLPAGILDTLQQSLQTDAPQVEISLEDFAVSIEDALERLESDEELQAHEQYEEIKDNVGNIDHISTFLFRLRQEKEKR